LSKPGPRPRVTPTGASVGETGVGSPGRSEKAEGAGEPTEGVRAARPSARRQAPREWPRAGDPVARPQGPGANGEQVLASGREGGGGCGGHQ